MFPPGASPAEQPPDFQKAGQGFAAGMLDAGVIDNLRAAIGKAVAEGGTEAAAAILKAAITAAGFIAETLAEAEDRSAPGLQRLARTAINDLLGVDVGSEFGTTGAGGGGRKASAERVGAAIIAALFDSPATIEPSDAAAKRYISAVTNFALEGWNTGWVFELLTSVLPWVEGVQTFGELDDVLARVLGFERLSRRVLGPYVDTLITTPTEWHIKKAYRPTLLAVATAVQQFHRGNWTRDKLDEELARQGFSAERIEALINGQRKFFSAGDVRTFVDRNHWPMDRGLQHLRDQGFDEDTASDAIRLEGLRRVEQLEASEASAIIGAYADRRITGGEFGSMLRAAVTNDQERALLEELAEVRRAVNIRHLSPGEARACAKEGVLAVRDYERALEREGYTPEAVDALGLLLRVEMAEKRDVEEARRQQREERAAEKAERDAAAAERRAQVDADRARRRRGPIGDLERAAVRGLIPFERLAEVLTADYDPDTVQILLSLVEDDRQRYLAQQAAAEEARKRNVVRQLDVGDLERAVLANLLTVEEFEQRLLFAHYAPADAALLTAVVRAKKADQDLALARRRAAELAAERRRIDLARFERLVRRGARSLADYDALLIRLGFEDADRAAMRELLEIQIADDRKADAERAAAERDLQPRGLSLEQMRRAVVLGTRTEDDYQRFLVDQHFTADAQAVLLADLRFAVAEADDARRRRDEAQSRTGARRLPLSTLQRAARLGIVAPQTYLDRLRADGYDEDDLAVELELLVIEIADAHAARAKRTIVPSPQGERALTLAQVERAVRAGAQTIEDYRAAAIAAGMTAEAVEIASAVLLQEAGTLTEARAVRADVLRQLAAGNVALEELERPVLKAGKPIAVFVGELQALGIGADESELVAALLVEQLEAAAQKSGGGNG